MSSAMDVRISPSDRLGFTLFIAIALHAMLILGIAFKPQLRPQAEQTLEVTLASFQSDKAPDKADFIAQSNQQGSGDLAEVKAPSSPEQAVFQANEVKPLAADQAQLPVPEMRVNPLVAPADEQTETEQQPSQADSKTPRERVVTQHQQAEAVTEAVEPKPKASSRPATGMATALLARSLEIAALEAKLDVYAQTRAKAPKIRRLYSASTRESYDAAYLDGWRRKVERVGNINYPEEAHRRQLYGNLRMLVVVRPDGELDRVEVIKSSGHRVLDDAAMRIVRLAAPFAPFPPELRRHADLVEIIRTWKFEKARFGVNG